MSRKTRYVKDYGYFHGKRYKLSADIKVTHPDGSVTTGIIQPLKGVNEITLDGIARDRPCGNHRTGIRW